MIDKIRQRSLFVIDDALLSKEKINEKLQQLQEDIDKRFDVNEKKNLSIFFSICIGDWVTEKRRLLLQSLLKS